MSEADGIKSGMVSDNAFVSMLCRHLVGLVVEYQSKDDSGAPVHSRAVISGFVLELHSRWFWVTAGHTLKDYLDKPINDGTLRIIDSGFADYWVTDAEHRHLYPFRYEPGCAFYIEAAEDSLDFGLIPLDGLMRQAFAKNGVIPISRNNWISQHQLEFSVYKMLGFPAHENRVRTIGGVTANYALTALLDLERITNEEAGPSAGDEWFSARLHPGAKLPSIEGMSGGPIYGFRKVDDRWSYHVVALQSRWWPERRIIFGCSLPRFAEAVYHDMAELLGEHRRPED